MPQQRRARKLTIAVTGPTGTFGHGLMPLLQKSLTATLPEGDAYFPQVNLDLFKESGTIDVPANPNDSAAFRIKIYRRAPNARR